MSKLVRSDSSRARAEPSVASRRGHVVTPAATPTIPPARRDERAHNRAKEEERRYQELLIEEQRKAADTRAKVATFWSAVKSRRDAYVYRRRHLDRLREEAMAPIKQEHQSRLDGIDDAHKRRKEKVGDGVVTTASSIGNLDSRIEDVDRQLRQIDSLSRLAERLHRVFVEYLKTAANEGIPIIEEDNVTGQELRNPGPDKPRTRELADRYHDELSVIGALGDLEGGRPLKEVLAGLTPAPKKRNIDLFELFDRVVRENLPDRTSDRPVSLESEKELAASIFRHIVTFRLTDAVKLESEKLTRTREELQGLKAKAEEEGSAAEAITQLDEEALRYWDTAEGRKERVRFTNAEMKALEPFRTDAAALEVARAAMLVRAKGIAEAIGLSWNDALEQEFLADELR